MEVPATPGFSKLDAPALHLDLLLVSALHLDLLLSSHSSGPTVRLEWSRLEVPAAGRCKLDQDQGRHLLPDHSMTSNSVAWVTQTCRVQSAG
eukprot:1074423-Rhodomonas_salina.1